jgi:hypothetical protein
MNRKLGKTIYKSVGNKGQVVLEKPLVELS